MEKRMYDKIEKYMRVDFYKNLYSKDKFPYSIIVDTSDKEQSEIEKEDALKQNYLWLKRCKRTR